MYTQIAIQLKTLRKSQKLTQKEFAQLIETTTRSLGRYEAGTHRITLYALHKTNQSFQTDWSTWLDSENESTSVNYTFPSHLTQQSDDEKSFYQLLGKRIAYLRKLRGLSQRELSKQLDLSDRALAYYERGIRRIHIEDVIKLALALHVTAHELLFDL